MQPDRQSASLDGCAHLISYHRSAPYLMVDLARYVVPTLRYGCAAREPDLDGRPYHLPDLAGHSRNRPQPWQNVMVVRGRGTRPPVCQCGATGLWDGLATASLASFRIHTSDRGHVGIEPGLQMADPVGTRERRVLASFRRSDPPQEGGHQGVVVEIEGVHVDVGGQWTVFNKDRDRLRGGLDPTGEAIGVVDQHYPKHRRMSTQRNRAGRQLPERNRLIGRYPVRDFTMRDIGISIPPPRQSPCLRIPELAETEQHRLIRWRLFSGPPTSVRQGTHSRASPQGGAHGPPYRV